MVDSYFGMYFGYKNGNFELLQNWHGLVSSTAITVIETALEAHSYGLEDGIAATMIADKS